MGVSTTHGFAALTFPRPGCCVPFAVAGDRQAWRLRLRRRRLPGRYLAGIATGITGLVAVPYAEELWRCARDRRQRGPRSLGVI